MSDPPPPDQHRISAHTAPDVGSPPIHTDPDIVRAFLVDAAHVQGGFASGVAFPTSVHETAALVARASRVLPVGAQSSLTGGATPRGELLLSTRALTHLGDPDGECIRVGAGVPLARLQQHLARDRLFYPPVPTYDGATVGGVISTNAAGPATFKHGATRRWVNGLTVVLANGEILEIERGRTTASPAGHIDIVSPSRGVMAVPMPSYRMPEIPKLSAGYCAGPAPLDLIDLFIGSEGTLGVIVGATLRVVPRPRRSVLLLTCRDDQEALTITAALREEAHAAWRGEGPLDVEAVDYIDARALAMTQDDAFRRAGVPRPSGPAVLLVVQLDVSANGDTAFDRLARVLDAHGTAEPLIAGPGDERGASAILGLREAVPIAINARVAAAQAAGYPEIQKTAGDMIVPFERLSESLAIYRQAFDARGLDYAIWGHLSDGNLHPNVVPRSVDDVVRGREALLEIGRQITAIGGAPLAEHGVGRSVLKQQMLRELYGEDGIEQMRRVKRAIDPDWKLAPGLIFSRGT